MTVEDRLWEAGLLVGAPNPKHPAGVMRLVRLMNHVVRRYMRPHLRFCCQHPSDVPGQAAQRAVDELSAGNYPRWASLRTLRNRPITSAEDLIPTVAYLMELDAIINAHHAHGIAGPGFLPAAEIGYV